MIIIACRTHNNLLGPKESRKILIVRGVLGMTYLLSLHFSVKLISPSDSVSLVHLNIVIVSLLARVFLSEKINLAHIVSLIMSMAGVFLIAQPSFLFNKSPISFNLTFNLTENNKSNTTLILDEFSIASSNITEKMVVRSGDIGGYLNEETKKITGVCLALISAFAIAFQSIILKKLSNKKVHFSISIVYGCYFGLPVSFLLSILMFLFNNDTSLIGRIIFCANKCDQNNLGLMFVLYQCFFSFTSAVCGVVSQILMNMALDHEDASKVSMLRSTELFFTFLLQYLVLAIFPNLLSAIGAVLIMIGTFFILIHKLVDMSITRSRLNSRAVEHDEDDSVNCVEHFKNFLLFKF